MIRFFKIALVLTLSILFANCTKNNTDVTPTPAEPYAVQYPKDTLKIVEYMNNYSMKVDADYNVEFIKADTDNPSIKMKFGNAGTKQLKFNIVKRDGVEYKVYYIPLREGTGDMPIEVDSVFASYTGRLVSDNIVFDKTPTPIWFTLDNVIQGWRKIFPLFKSGDKTVNTITGSVTYNNYGAGVIFIPSGLAYYNRPPAGIPGYANLIFNFKLNAVNYVDNDYDRIDSRYEDINKDGIGDGDPTNNDTDSDGIPDYLDQDDDGDNYPTKYEIKKPNGSTVDDGPSSYYPFDPIISNPPKPTDEKRGIPSCTSVYTGNRIRKHLDPSCH